jgi:GDPmannose 4,6-dehydratase
MTTALILGVAGQDGTYLAELLRDKGYTIVGCTRDASLARQRLPIARFPELILEQCDCADPAALERLLTTYRPDEVYNLAARSSGIGMFDEPAEIAIANGVAVARLLHAIHITGLRSRVCQASSSEMFGAPHESPQTETTPFHPRSPYGAAKVYAHTMVDIYRRTYGTFAASLIFFNHESPLRAPHFVTRKVTLGAASIALGKTRELRLGNLDARRDWGFAGDYVRAMWLALQHAEPADYVIATGTTHSVRELCAIAFDRVGLDYRQYVVSDAAAYRPDQPVQLVGNAEKARTLLRWHPTVAFADMIRAMVDADSERIRSGAASADILQENR